MIATSHVIIGGAAALAVSHLTNNPAAGLAVGIASHLLCDSIPHLDYPPNTKFINGEIVWDKTLYIFAIADSLIAFFLILAIWYFKFDLQFLSIFAWGALGGYLPDLIDNFPGWRFQIRKLSFFQKFHEFHLWIHHNWDRKFTMPKYWLLGTVSQIIFIIPCLWFILK
jgi:hypothetical protein